MILVDLDVHQIVGYHYFDHHQPSRGVRLAYFRAGCRGSHQLSERSSVIKAGVYYADRKYSYVG